MAVENDITLVLKGRAMEFLQKMAERRPSGLSARLATVSHALQEVEMKIHNLVELAEKGVDLESVAGRLAELEEQQKRLREE